MEFLFFVPFLLVTPFLVFRLIIIDKEKGGTPHAEKYGSLLEVNDV